MSLSLSGGLARRRTEEEEYKKERRVVREIFRGRGFIL
jgi:hypothetical protein